MLLETRDAALARMRAPLPVLRFWPAEFMQDTCDKALTQVEPAARAFFWRTFWEQVLGGSDRAGDAEAIYELFRLAGEAHKSRA